MEAGSDLTFFSSSFAALMRSLPSCAYLARPLLKPLPILGRQIAARLPYKSLTKHRRAPVQITAAWAAGQQRPVCGELRRAVHRPAVLRVASWQCCVWGPKWGDRHRHHRRPENQRNFSTDRRRKQPATRGGQRTAAQPSPSPSPVVAHRSVAFSHRLGWIRLGY